MDIQRYSPEETKALLDSGQGYIYLDVRTVQEFEAGHVPGARNIPLLEMTPRGMVPNSDFVELVSRHFPKDARLICGCQKGHRSLRAAEVLQTAGFANVADMRGGFGGETDHCGCVITPGWATIGLPVTRESSPDERYDILRSALAR